MATQSPCDIDNVEGVTIQLRKCLQSAYEACDVDLQMVTYLDSGILSVRWPYGWEDMYHVDNKKVDLLQYQSVERKQNRPAMTRFDLPACKRFAIMEVDFEEHVKRRIKRGVVIAIKVWGAMKSEKIHQALGSDGSNVVGGYIGLLNDNDILTNPGGKLDVRHKANVGKWGEMYHPMSAQTAKENAKTWRDV